MSDDTFSKSRDSNRRGRRLIRYAQVSRRMGNLAAKIAGERYLGINFDRGRHAEDLKNALGGLKGPLMKVAQLLATIPDALPSEYAAELRQLQSNAPSMGWPFVRRRMATELGTNWESKFNAFDREASYAASLGQVHRARSKDGRLLACKLQYPNMDSAVEADLAQLKLIFNIFRKYDESIDPTSIYQEIADRLREELDYEREARHARLYHFLLRDEEGVTVPIISDDLSTDRLLTMTWLEGRSLLELAQERPEIKNTVALNMFRAWYVPFYFFGIIHGDPHLGNYTGTDEGAINLLDFGCIRIFESRFVEGVIDLYRALLHDDPDLAVAAYESWGFTNLSTETIEVLNVWAHFVYAPLLENKTRKIQSDGGGQYGATVASKVHAELRRLGGVRPPREFVLVDRAAVGLGSVFMHLGAEINWHKTFENLIDGFEVEELRSRQQQALKRVELS